MLKRSWKSGTILVTITSRSARSEKLGKSIRCITPINSWVSLQTCGLQPPARHARSVSATADHRMREPGIAKLSHFNARRSAIRPPSHERGQPGHLINACRPQLAPLVVGRRETGGRAAGPTATALSSDAGTAPQSSKMRQTKSWGLRSDSIRTELAPDGDDAALRRDKSWN